MNRLQVLVRAGAWTVRIECSDAALLDSIARAYDGLSAREPADEVITIDVDGDRAFITVGERPGRWASRSMAMKRVVGFLNLLTLDSEPELLHFHAGAVVSKAGVSVIFPASAHTGKTTLVAIAVASGFCYLTDEQIGVNELCQLSATPKPLSLRKGGSEVLVAELTRLGRTADVSVIGFSPAGTANGTQFVPPTALGDVYEGPSEPGVIAFLEPADGEAPELLPVAPQEAVVLLMQNASDFGRLGIEAFRRTVEIVSRSDCFRMFVGEPMEMTMLLEDACSVRAERDTGPVPPVVPVSSLGGRPAAPGLVIADFLNGSVLYEPKSQRAVTIDGDRRESNPALTEQLAREGFLI